MPVQEIVDKALRFHRFVIKMQIRLGDASIGPSTAAFVNCDQTPVWRDGGVSSLQTVDVKGADTVDVKGEKMGQATSPSERASERAKQEKRTPDRKAGGENIR